VLVGMLEQAGIVRRGYDQGRAMRIELLDVGAGAGTVVDELLERYAREAAARVERIVGFAGSDRCRHAQVAEHFGERLEPPCGSCDVCDPPPSRAGRPTSAPLPADVAGAIYGAVERLTWPLGRRSLVAMLRGSVAAPPSARASAAFGLLEAASDAEVRRWVTSLESAGALVEAETDDGYRVLHAGPGAALPSLGPKAAGPVDDRLLERLRSWRRDRSREDGVPAYVVLHDATLRDLAAARPTSVHELSGVKGLGSTKIERYGADLLAVLAAAP
jgi:ATP-dependent DNA helicase RecQ